MKKRLITPRIVILMLISLVACGMLTGCAPKGFIKKVPGSNETDPLIYNGEHTGSGVLMMDQFPDINSNELYGLDKLFFIFDGNEGKIEISRRPFRGAVSSEGITVFLADEKIGSFTDVEQEWGSSGGKYLTVGWVFMYENYLYYRYTKETSKGYIMDWRDIYYRHEFYRFNLETCKNEEIKLTQFAEALQTIDSNYEINPNYVGEK